MPSAGEPGRKLVIGVGLKMYFGYRETLEWCGEVRAIAASNPAISSGAVRLFVMPSAPFLAPVIDLYRGTAVEVGAQDLFYEDRGPYTGEVGGGMLAELGCRLVEVGHSERRRLFGDSERVVALKVQAALRHGLCPVICVGEEMESSAEAARLEAGRQLDSALSDAARSQTGGRVIVAYEPQWAIGADSPAADTHIAEVCRGLQVSLREMRPGSDGRVIYGGSAGPGLLERIGGSVDGLFLGRYVHDPRALASVLEEAGRLVK